MLRFLTRKRRVEKKTPSPLPMGVVCTTLSKESIGEERWRVRAHVNGSPEAEKEFDMNSTPWPFFVPVHWDGETLQAVSAL